GVPALVQQRAQALLAAVLLQPDHFAAHQGREHGPEALPLAALDFVDAEMPGAALWTGAIPLGEKRFLGTPGLPPAHAMPHGGVTGRHRLAVEADLLAQAPR